MNGPIAFVDPLDLFRLQLSATMELDEEIVEHINYDSYRPTDAHCRTIEEVTDWCLEAGLEIVRTLQEDTSFVVCDIKK